MNASREILGEIFSWTVRGSLYAVAVISIIVLTQILLRRVLSPQWSYALWLILLVRLALPVGPVFDWSIWNLTPQHPRQWTSWMDSDYVMENQSISDTSTATLTMVVSDDVSPRNTFWHLLRTVLPGIWLAGVLVVISGIVIGNWRLWRSVRDLGCATDVSLLKLFEECRRQMRVRTMVGLVVTDQVKSPLLFGFIRPRVLLPADLVRQIPAEQLRYIFLHELAHLKRCDILVGWGLAFLQALHWFNPLVWWAFGRMRFDRELACDASVLARVPDRERCAYGRILINMLEHFNHSQNLPAIAGILENKSQLKRRLIMITKFQRPTRIAGILAFILMVVLSGVVLTEANSGDSQTRKSADAEAIAYPEEPEIQKESSVLIIEDAEKNLLTSAQQIEMTETNSDKDPIQLAQVDTSNRPPELIYRVLPEFPEAARNAGLIDGIVVFQVKINENGQIEDAKTISGEPVFIEAAQEAVEQWLFNPALRDGTPIPFAATIEVTFQRFGPGSFYPGYRD